MSKQNLMKNESQYTPLLVPVELLSYSISNKCLHELRTFLFLKHISNGHIFNLRSSKRSLAVELGLSPRTVDNHLNRLLIKGWACYNKNLDRVHLRSFSFLYCSLKLGSRQAANFQNEYLNNFSGWAFGVILVSMLNWQKGKRWLRDRTKRRSLQINHLAPLSANYIGLAITVIANRLKISQGHTFNLKCQAIKGGFIITKSKFQQLSKDPADYFAYLKVFKPGQLIMKNNKVYLRKHDEIIPKIRLKKRRKNNELYIKRGYGGEDRK